MEIRDSINVILSLAASIDDADLKRTAKQLQAQIEDAFDSVGKNINGIDLSKFVKDTKSSLTEAAEAYKKYNKSLSRTDLKNVLNWANALKASGNDDLTKVPDELRKSLENLFSVYNVNKGKLGEIIPESELKEAYESIEKIQEASKEFENAMNNLTSGSATGTLGSVISEISDALKKTMADIGNGDFSSVNQLYEALKKIEGFELPDSAQKTATQVSEEGSAAKEAADAMERLAKAKEKVANANKSVADSAKETEAGLEQEGDAAKQAAKKFSGDEIEAATSKIRDALSKLNDGSTKYSASVSSSGLVSITKTVKEASGELNTYTANFKSFKKVLESIDGGNFAEYIKDLGNVSSAKYLDSYAESAKASAAQIDGLRLSIENFKNTASDFKTDSVQELLDKLQSGISSSDFSDVSKKFSNLVKEYRSSAEYFQDQARAALKTFKVSNGLTDASGNSWGELVPETVSRGLEDLQKTISEINDKSGLDKFKASLKEIKDLGKSTDFKSLDEAKESFERFGYAIKSETTSGFVAEMDKFDGSIERVTVSMDELNGKITQTSKTTTVGKLNEEVGTLEWGLDTLKSKGQELVNIYLDFTDIIRYVQEGFSSIVDVNSAMTELRKVSDESLLTVKNYFDEANASAQELGTSTVDLISATADWSRLGYSLEDSKELAKVSVLYTNVGDDIDIDEANESLVSTMQGYQLDADQALNVIDQFNEVSNNFAIDSAGIGEALQRSASSFYAANTDLSKSIALVTATNAVVQNPEEVGTMWKTVSMRIRGAKTELEEAGLDTDNMAESTSKLRDTIQSMTGFDIMKDEDTFKDIYDIVLGIGKEWQNLTDVEQASLLETLAGKRQGNALSAVLNNIDDLEAAYDTAINADGSALEEQEKYADSLQYSLDSLTAAAEGFWHSMISDDLAKGVLDTFSSIVNGASNLTDSLGSLSVLGGILGVSSSASGSGFLRTNRSGNLSLFGIQLDEFGTGIKDLFSGKGLSRYTSQKRNFLSFAESLKNNSWDIEAARNEVSGVTDSMVAFASTCEHSDFTWENYTAHMGGASSTLSKVESLLKGLGLSLANMAIGVVLGEVVNLIYKVATAAGDAAEEAEEAGESLSSANTELSDYQSQVAELQAVLDDSSSTFEEQSSARAQLLSIQQEMVEKYGSEAGAVNAVTQAVQGQASAWEELASQQYAVTKSEYNSEGGFVRSIANFLSGYEDNMDRMRSNMEEQDFLLESVVGTKYNTSEYHDAIQEILDRNNLTVTDTDMSGGGTQNRVSGSARDIQAATAELQNFLDVNSSAFGSSEVERYSSSLSSLSDNMEEIISQYGTLYDYSTFEEKIMGTGDLARSYQQAYDEINGYYEDYQEAVTAGDESTAKEIFDDYAMALNSAMENALSNGDADVASYFERMHEDLESQVSTWDLTKAFNSNTDGVRDSIEKAVKTLGMTGDELSVYDGTVGTEEQIAAWKELTNVLDNYGLTVSDSISTLEDLGSFDEPVANALSERIQELENASAEIKQGQTDRLKELSEGGAVDLTKTIPIDTGALKKAGWDEVAGDLATVYSNTYSNEDGTVAINFTPIVRDKNGNAISVLSPDVLESYAEDVISGVRTDNLNLQVGVEYNGEDAVEQAEEAAKEIHTIHEDYFSDSIDLSGYLSSEGIDTTEEYNSFMEIVKGANSAEEAILAYEDSIREDRISSFSYDIEEATTNFESLSTAATEAASATGLSSDSITFLEGRYEDLEGFDVASLFGTTASGVRVNAEALAELEEQYEKVERTNLTDHLQDLEDEYNRLTDKINNAADAGDLASQVDLYSQRNDILDEINDTSLLISQYNSLASAYTKWQNATSSTNRATYSTVTSGYGDVKESISQGWIGDSDVRAYMELLTGKDLDLADYKELEDIWDSITEKIEGTEFSIKDFLTTDDDDNVTSDGIFNFIGAIEQADELGEKYAYIDEEGNQILDLSGDHYDKVAETLGISEELLDILVEAAKGAGFSVEYDEPTEGLELSETKAEELTGTLEALGLKGFSFNIETDDISDIESQINTLNEFINENYTDETGVINLSTEGGDAALELMVSLVKRKQELETPILLSADVDTASLSEAEQTFLTDVQTFQDSVNNLEIIKLKFSLGSATQDDVTAAQQSVQSAVNQLNANSPTIMANLGISGASADEIKSKLSTTTIDMIAQANTTTAESELNALATDKTKNVYVATPNLTAKKSQLDALSKNSVKTIRVITKYSTISSSITSGNAMGTFRGFASGSDVSLPYSQDALINELGTEGILRDGILHEVPGNAHIEHLKAGDVIFNAKQMEELRKTGYVRSGGGRGRLIGSFVDGTLNGLPGYVKATGPTRKKSSKKSSSSSSDSDSSGSSSSGKSSSSSSSTSKTTSKIKNVLDKIQTKISKLFDWIEVRIENQSDNISKFIDKAETAVDTGAFKTAAKYYRKAISATATQAGYEDKAADKYYAKANKIYKMYQNAKTSYKKDDDGNWVVDTDQTLTKKDKATIKKAYARLKSGGTINISSYNERVKEAIENIQTWYEKGQDAEDALADLHEQIRTYIEDLKEVNDAQRDAKISASELYNEIASNVITTTASEKNSQLNYSIKNENTSITAYRDATNQAAKEVNYKKNGTVAKTANSSVKSELKNTKATKKNKSYRSALKKAQTAIKSKKEISSSILKVIKKNNQSLYEKLYAYNLALDNLETAREEEATNYAEAQKEIYEAIAEKYENLDSDTEDKADLYQQKADNATSASSKNSYLDKVAATYDKIVSNDQKETNEYSKKMTAEQKEIAKSNKSQRGSNYSNLSASSKKNVNKYIDAAQKAAKAGKQISSSVIARLAKYYAKGYITRAFYESCISYNDALASKEQAEKQLEIDEETRKAEQAALAEEKVSNIKDEYETELSQNEATTTSIETSQNLKTTRGLTLGTGDYQKLIAQSKAQQVSYVREAVAVSKQIQDNLISGYWTTSSQEYKDALLDLEDIKNSAEECEIEQEEWNNAIAELPYETAEKYLDLLDAIADYNKSLSDLKESMGEDLSESDYQQQISDNNDQISKLTEEQTRAYGDYLKALNNTDGVYGGKTSNEWLESYYEFSAQINDLKADNESLKDELRDDVYWRTYERAHETAERYADVLSGISDLISDDMYFDKDGNLTEFGIAQMANLVKQYEIAREEVANYSNDIDNLNQLYAEGWYTQEEYKEKLAELRDGLLDAAGDMQSAISDVIEMNKDVAQEELDALLELIDARNDALDKKKEYYEYDKTIRNANKEIQTLQAQIAALDGVSDAASKAKKAQLEAELEEQQEDLEDTVNEHILDLSQESLDNMKESLQEAFDDKWDYIYSNLDEIASLMSSANELTQASATNISEALNRILEYYGISSVDVVGGYASGTKKVTKAGLYEINEDGRELVTKDGRILIPLSSGDGVLNHKLTERLYSMAENGTSVPNMENLVTRVPNIQSSPSITQTFDNLINIEGSADAATVEDLKNMRKDLLQTSYEYTSKKMANGYLRSGGKRIV